jgi:hypothetical protein
MADDSEERRFQIGDIVRFKSGYRTPLSFDIAPDEVGTVVGVESHPPQTGPTYRISVQFPHGLVEGVFQHEYELTAEPQRKPINEQGLKDLILETIAKHRVCPPGMDVSINSLGDGNWEAVGIPPAQGPPYADCVDYIAQIAKAVRLNYYLQVLGGITIAHEVTAPERPPTVQGVAAEGVAGSLTPSLSVPLKSGEATLAATSSLSADAQHLRADDLLVGAATPRAANGRSTFDLRLSERPTDIRDAARTLAAAVKDQIETLKQSPPRGVNDLEKHDEFVNFLEKLASGLNELADALDRMIEANAKRLNQPFFTEEARRIARQLGASVIKFAEAHPIADYSIKIGLAIAGYDFMRICGLDNDAAIAGAVGAILAQSFSKKNKQE